MDFSWNFLLFFLKKYPAFSMKVGAVYPLPIARIVSCLEQSFNKKKIIKNNKFILYIKYFFLLHRLMLNSVT